MDNKNIHEGHRARFREHVYNTGLYNLTDIHYLEYLLQFVISRADTNPIAHELLNEFKTIDGIFDASLDALKMVNGVGDKTARFLHAMAPTCFMYRKSKALKKPFIGNLKCLISFLHDILPPSTNEQFIILIAGKNFEVKSYKVFSGISHSYINFDSKELTEYLIKHKTSFCILAHTHPEHNALPSGSDNATFQQMAPLLDALSIQLLDNIILGEKDVFSYRTNSIRYYSEIDADFIANHKYDLNKWEYAIPKN